MTSEDKGQDACAKKILALAEGFYEAVKQNLADEDLLGAKREAEKAAQELQSIKAEFGSALTPYQLSVLDECTVLIDKTIAAMGKKIN